MHPALHRESLQPHPSHRPTAVHELSVAIQWGSTLALRYALLGSTDALLIPAPSAPQRTDELWRHTCFELFIAAPRLEGYCEFNFSPGGPWAAYRFDGYRSGMQVLDCAPPTITSHMTATQLEVQVELALASAPLLAAAQELRCALTAVVEERSGARSFWSLVHAAAQPDFHHPDGFALHLLRSGRADSH